jgi:choline-sulfatase
MLNRRAFVKIGAAAVVTSRVRGAAAAPKRPNLLLIMDDQHRGDCLRSAGNRAIYTPNLDRLAAEGARFRCAYSSTPTCTPARAALLTGMSPWGHGMLGYSRVGEKYPVEMPRVLAEAGYYTMAIGKLHYHPQRNIHGFHQALLDESGRAESPEFRSDYRCWFWSMAPGLDPDATGIGWNDYRAKAYALPEQLHPTRWAGETATRFISAYDRSQPFFLKVSFERPHSPYDPPERLMKRYAEADLPRAAVGKWAARYAPPSDDSFNIWHGDLGPEQVRHSRQGYYGSVTHVDEEVGRILEALEKRGWLDDTLILFTADHGDMTGDHNLWRKSYAYEASAHIPMLVRWSRTAGSAASARRGQVPAEPVELRDVLPTFLDAAGITVKQQLEGRSLLSLVRGDTTNWRKYIDLEHNICYSPENNWSALTDGRFKYIFHARDGEEQLFNLERDPNELNDLAPLPEHAGTLNEWRGRMTEQLAVRGEEFVKGGKLALRPKGVPFSPNYPGCSCHPRKT